MTALQEWDDETEPESFLSLATSLIEADNESWIFRGQSGYGYGLVTKLERDLAGSPRSRWPAAERSLLLSFQERVRAHLDRAPHASDIVGWWALMQHYGAPTRLLDWTQSPFVALYFVFAEMGDDDGDGALWCLRTAPLVEFHHRDATGDGVPSGAPAPVLDLRPPGGQDENEDLRAVLGRGCPVPYPVLPRAPDRRMIAQQAVLTCDPALDGGIPFPLAVGGQALLKKVRLPGAWRREALRALRTMGLTSDALFPGLDGIGRDLTLRSQNDQLLSLRDVLEDRRGGTVEHVATWG